MSPLRIEGPSDKGIEWKVRQKGERTEKLIAILGFNT